MRPFFLIPFLLACSLFAGLAYTAEPVIKNLSTANAQWIRDYIVPAPDFPTPGVTFQWYGPLMRTPEAFSRVIKEFAAHYQGQQIDAILGLESRGFIFGSALAYELGIPFVLVRKPGKLPGPVISSKYEKEYGPDCLEIECVALNPGDNVVIIDDLIATGGTALAACHLVERLGANVLEVACMIELPVLGGREKIGYPVYSLLAVDDY